MSEANGVVRFDVVMQNPIDIERRQPGHGPLVVELDLTSAGHDRYCGLTTVEGTVYDGRWRYDVSARNLHGQLRMDSRSAPAFYMLLEYTDICQPYRSLLSRALADDAEPTNAVN